jgi:hypothetical protein
MSIDKYILVGTAPKKCTDQATWLRWYSSADRHVAVTSIEHHGLVVTVVSQFLGMDDEAPTNASPALFETSIFGGPLDQKKWRVPSWCEALSVHATAVQKVTRALARDVRSVA